MEKLDALLQRSGWRARGFDFLVGALAVAGHAPFHIWPITIGCFIYLFWRLDYAPSARFKPGFGRGFWFALGYFLVGIYWISSAFTARGQDYVWLGPPMVLGLAAVMAFFWGLAGGFFTRFRPRGIFKVGAFVSLLFMAEFARGHAFGGFPWNLPGYIFKGGGAGSQFASILGIYGLGFLVFLVSGLLASMKFSARPVIPFIVAGLILAGQFGFGAWRLSNAETKYVEGPLIRVVQVQFDQKDKFDPDKSIDIVNQFLTESIAPGLENITHIIWPEGAVSGLALENDELIQVMGELLSAQRTDPPIWLLNSLRHERLPDSQGLPTDKYFNTAAAVAFDAEGIARLVDYNDKIRLVPFGEFIPLEKFLKTYGPQTLSTSLASISPGDKKITSLIPGLPRVSPQICYEIIFSGLTPRPPEEPRAEWILNQTNDAWYGNSLGPRQHANIAQYRAIEEGLPVIRAASNGISGSIDPFGRFLSRVDMDKTQSLDFQLPRSIPQPFFFGKVNWYLLLLNIIIGLVSLTLYRGQERVVDEHNIQ